MKLKSEKVLKKIYKDDNIITDLLRGKEDDLLRQAFLCYFLFFRK